MKINDDLETIIRAPLNGFLEVVGLVSLDIRLTGRSVKSPVADRDSDVVEASTGDLSKIGFSVKGGPMRREPAVALLAY